MKSPLATLIAAGFISEVELLSMASSAGINWLPALDSLIP
jgi:hypothetical protein